MEEQKNVAVESETESEKVNSARKYDQREFLEDYAWTEKLYRAIIVVSCILAAASIGVAVIWKVSYGLIGAFVTVVFYLTASSNMLYSRLGLAQRSNHGELTVTEVYGQKREEVYLPEKLFWNEVTVLGSEACDHKSTAEMKVLHLPRTLKRIDADALKGATMLERICYGGNEEEWAEVEVLCELDGIEICFDELVEYPVKEKKPKKQKKQKSKKNKIDDTEQSAESGGEEQE
jgi:hypothetical protein